MTKDNTRVKGEKLDINYDETIDFFERRASKENLPNLYNHTMYQDNNPEIVLQRNEYEKNKIRKIVNFNKDDVVLDLGCGVARWGEDVLSAGATYVGVDFSQGLISLAEKNLLNFGDSFHLINASFDKFYDALIEKNINLEFTKILITAVMIYVNDSEIKRAFSDINKTASDNNVIYIKETISKDNRLTLNHFYSQDLDDSYNAIYRTRDEYFNLIDSHFSSNDGYDITHEGPLYDDKNLNNRNETEQYYFIVERNSNK